MESDFVGTMYTMKYRFPRPNETFEHRFHDLAQVSILVDHKPENGVERPGDEVENELLMAGDPLNHRFLNLAKVEFSDSQNAKCVRRVVRRLGTLLFRPLPSRILDRPESIKCLDSARQNL